VFEFISVDDFDASELRAEVTRADRRPPAAAGSEAGNGAD
jgi:hypothetical protein